MPDFTVRRRGTDSSGRGIFATDYMWDWWQRVLDQLPFGDQVVITQGAFMTRAGGGAHASAGYHDDGGCFDLRVWNLTDPQVATTVRTLRANGAAAWLRNVVHGGFEDPHIHLVLGTDKPLAAGARQQWASYQAGGDGLSGSDYHPRPDPLVLTPPKDWFDMATPAELKTVVEAAVAPVIRRLDRLREASQRRQQRLLEEIDAIAADQNTDSEKIKERLRVVRQRIAQMSEDDGDSPDDADDVAVPA